MFLRKYMKSSFPMGNFLLIFKFLFVGAAAYLTLVSSVFILVNYLDASLLLAYIVGYLMAIPVHYLGNSKLTFKTLALNSNLFVKYIVGLFCFFTICVILEYVVSQFDQSLLTRVLLVTAPSIAISFLINWCWVFSNHR
jgi:putative flippase GtrA